MERTGIEPVTSGLQSQSIARRRLTTTNRIRMARPQIRVFIERGSTSFDGGALARARTAAAYGGNICARGLSEEQVRCADADRRGY